MTALLHIARAALEALAIAAFCLTAIAIPFFAFGG